MNDPTKKPTTWNFRLANRFLARKVGPMRSTMKIAVVILGLLPTPSFSLSMAKLDQQSPSSSNVDEPEAGAAKHGITLIKKKHGEHESIIKSADGQADGRKLAAAYDEYYDKGEPKPH